MYYNTKQAMYRDMAVSWVKWSASVNVTEEQRRGISMFFKTIGRRFGLLNEFKDIGVI
jgi:hypothetical protein